MDIESQIRTLHASGISRAKAALTIGIPRWRLDLFISAMNLDWKLRIRGGSCVIDGITDTLLGHSERLGVSVGKIRWRLQNDKPLEAPTTITLVTPEEAQQYTELRKQGVAAWEAAKVVGRPYNTLRLAAKKFCPEYLEVAKAAPRIRRSPEEIEAAELKKAA